VTIVSADSTAEQVLALQTLMVSFYPMARATRLRPALMRLARFAKLVDSGKPVFGICLGHQMLGLALGAKTVKMKPKAIMAPITLCKKSRRARWKSPP
jgi:carbamoyl-phosphate synthase small subunit